MDDEGETSDRFMDFEPISAPPPMSADSSSDSRRRAFVKDVTGIVEEVLRSREDGAATSGGKFKTDPKPSTAPKDEGRNLVVCIDGTANQFSLTVRLGSIDTCRPLTETDAYHVEYARCRAVQPACC